MTGLREHFAETAASAKHYDVTEVVLRRTRRRRQLTRAAAAAAAIVVATSAAAVLTRSPALAPAVTEIDATGTATPGRLGWLPQTFGLPGMGDLPVLPALPADRGVGEGALVYRRGGKEALLTSDGTSYSVPGDVRGLSPDGRWLAYGAGGELVFRCLLDTRTRRAADSDVAGWSADGTRAVLAPRMPGGLPTPVAAVLDPADGTNQTLPIPDPEWWGPRGLSPSGELLLTPRHEFPSTSAGPPAPLSTTAQPDVSTTGLPEAASTTEPVATPGKLPGVPDDLGYAVGFVEPVTHKSRSVAILSARIGFGEQSYWSPERLAVTWMPDRLLFQALTTLDSAQSLPADVFEIDPATGGALRRWRLPPVTTLSDPFRKLITALPDGILLGVNDGAEPWLSKALEVLDPVTGARRTVLTMPPGAEFVLTRGGARPY
ncbi:hypothetical protein AB0J74_32055 [Asanoa sp. NPDC049573]|uniref:hypothetical protein n=1 Tax=Asanoa sp. NPDC049573 TaxID=3155396 RepID=UPI00343A79D0